MENAKSKWVHYPVFLYRTYLLYIFSTHIIITSLCNSKVLDTVCQGMLITHHSTS